MLSPIEILLTLGVSASKMVNLPMMTAGIPMTIHLITVGIGGIIRTTTLKMVLWTDNFYLL